MNTDQAWNLELCIKNRALTRPASHPSIPIAMDWLIDLMAQQLAQQLAIVTAKHQQDWDPHVLF